MLRSKWMYLKVIVVYFQYHTWYFVPDGQEKYVMKPTLIVSGVKLHAKSSGGKKRSFVLRAVGEGSTGQMRVFVNISSYEDSHVKKSFQPIYILKVGLHVAINVTVFRNDRKWVRCSHMVLFTHNVKKIIVMLIKTVKLAVRVNEA